MQESRQTAVGYTASQQAYLNLPHTSTRRHLLVLYTPQ